MTEEGWRTEDGRRTEEDWSQEEGRSIGRSFCTQTFVKSFLSPNPICHWRGGGGGA